MSERLTRLTANNQQPAKPGSDGGDNDATPGAIGHDASSGTGRDDGQPDDDHAEFVHVPKDSTTKALAHVVTALIAIGLQKIPLDSVQAAGYARSA